MDVIGRRHRLGERTVNGFGCLQPHIKGIRTHHRTGFAAKPATNAQARIDVSGLMAHPGGEASSRSFQPDHFRKGVQPYAGMPTGIHHQGAKDSDRTVVRGKDLVQLAHATANGWRTLHQVNLKSGPGQIKRGLNARDPAADHQNSPDFGSTHNPSQRLAGSGRWWQSEPPTRPLAWQPPCSQFPSRRW